MGRSFLYLTYAEESMSPSYKILILGASYGSLLRSKLALAGARGLHSSSVDRSGELVDGWLAKNRQQT